MESFMYAALRIRLFSFLLGVMAIGAAHAAPAQASDEEATAALNALYAKNPDAKALGEKAKAVIVFPSVLKAGLVVTGQGGYGAMFKDGKIVAHYNVTGAGAGLEAGVKTYSYALFLMSDKAMERLNQVKGLELGVEPNIVVYNANAGENISTTTAQHDVFAYVYDGSGLMGGISLQGVKITKLSK
jgi:YD repeat-containing protein